MTDKITIVHCPTCGQTVEWTRDNEFRPFCSARCKLIDLGTWAAEGYAIRTEDESASEDDRGQTH